MHGKGEGSPGELGFLADGGEMGAIMRAHDWSATPLGPLSTWPQSLRSALSICLNTEAVSAIYWGPEFRVLYNDAYGPALGTRHPGALGRPVGEVWPEIWDVMGSQLASVVATGRGFTIEAQPLTMRRHGRDEETFWFYSFAPIRGDSGGTAGVFVTAMNRTGQVLAERARDESERRLKQAADAAALSADFRALFEASPTPFLVVAPPDWIIVAPNDAYLRAMGMAREDQVGRRLFDVFPDDPEDPSADGVRNLTASLERVVATKAPDPMAVQRYAVRGADGRFVERWWSPTNTPVLGPDGEVALVIHRAEEVTELVRLRGEAAARDQIARDQQAVIDRLGAAEAALRESEARAKAIANSIDQMIWSTLPDGYHDYYNDRWYEFTGVPPGSTDGEAWGGMFHPEDQERAWGLWRHCLATGEPYHIEYRLRHHSGGYRWVLGRAQPVRDGNTGEITRWFGTCTDIQDIVAAREVLARSRGELERLVDERTAERDRMWETSPDLLLVIDFEGVFRRVNPAWTAILGYAPEELVGHHVNEFVIPDDHDATVEAYESAAEGYLPRIVNRYRHKDGSLRWISWTAAPAGHLTYATGRDVTVEHERAAQLEQAQEQLRQSQKLEAVGQLTGGVAHDFNNLLTIIRSSADLLRRPDLAEDRRRRYVDAIADTVDRASRLTGQLLAFARRQALKPEVFDAAERVRSVADMLRSVVGSRIEIIAEIGDGACFVEADISQFETALVNMAVNARDAMDGEGTLTIRVGGVSAMPPIRGHGGGPGQFVALSLSDTGSGIPEERLAVIFEPFYTTKEVGKGTGLGLSQVFGFAKQSGGDVGVESEVGRGTTFTLYLPRTEATAEQAAGADERRATATEDGRGQRLLVVEDNVEVGIFSTQLLQDLGYTTTWAANAVEALALLRAGQTFDAVFSDVVMPGMSGVELGEEIRRRYPALPVVLTSGYSHVLAEEGRHGFELIQKPYAAEELSRILRRVTRGRADPPH